MDWHAHSGLYRLDAETRDCIARGEVRAMVDIALTVAEGLDGLVIETDDGRMFCGHEIAYISMLADRPS